MEQEERAVLIYYSWAVEGDRKRKHNTTAIKPLRSYLMPNSSISKIRLEFGGIVGACPLGRRQDCSG